MADPTDPYRATLDLTRQLIACRSVTPKDDESLTLIADRLAPVGFACERIDRGGVRNLWATHGRGAPIVCLAGHVDVVPPGALERWTADPFTPIERDGRLYGRGASDMKASVAAMVTALERLAVADPAHAGTLALLLTSDEEGEAVNGTVAVVDALCARGVTIDACVIGEPTSTEVFGDTIKNGRRGSLSGAIRFYGVQCHVAYPERGRNPIHDGLPPLAALIATPWDDGDEDFQPTSFQITNVQAGSGATNVIPGVMEVSFNFRFSPQSSVAALQRRVHDVLDATGATYTVDWTLSGEPFVTSRGPLTDVLSTIIEEEASVRPSLSTHGGTSDGRFLSAVSREVVEFGPLNTTIHQVDEYVRLDELRPLTTIFERTVKACLERGS
ncbi:MAG: succinyl-diaminopimelate desuccinylase [Acidimicrobiia bacterium]|nr:succinyl-diaminopimelate desuccinylase [Acidimicrobiia bacterium]